MTFVILTWIYKTSQETVHCILIWFPNKYSKYHSRVYMQINLVAGNTISKCFRWVMFLNLNINYGPLFTNIFVPGLHNNYMVQTYFTYAQIFLIRVHDDMPNSPRLYCIVSFPWNSHFRPFVIAQCKTSISVWVLLLYTTCVPNISVSDFIVAFRFEETVSLGHLS